MPTGASRISRPIDFPTRTSRGCASKSAPRTSAPRTAITCASPSARRSRTAASTPNRSPITARGNALKKADMRFKIEPIERNARLQAAVCTREFFEARRGYGCDSGDPIFIVGLPRAGSTLLEQILASHSQVEGTTELPNILRFVRRVPGTRAGYPGTALSRHPRAADRRGFPQARREIPRRYPRLPLRQAAIHRQDAEQFPPHRAHSPDAAERQDHRCAARADGVLFQQFQAAVRIGAGVHLRHRRYRALLSQLRAADAALG